MSSRIFPRGTLALLVALLVAGLLPGLPGLPGLVPVAHGAEFTMATRATYRVEPEAGRVTVSVEVTFENTAPDPEGRFSLFEVVDLAIHPGAAEVTARDDEGRLNVSATAQDGFVQATVRPRQGVRYGEETVFTLSYQLPDGAAGDVRVRPSLVAFPVWSFGTSGQVSVSVPGDYEVSVDGDELTAERAADGWQLTSGSIADPDAWLAQVIASGRSSYETLARAVPLDGGTVDLQVRAWADDRAWGERTLDLLARGLPLLEEEIGLPYPEVGPLVVVESLGTSGGGFGEPLNGGTQVQAAFDEPPFTLLHQAAHAWYSERLAEPRWVLEGFASRAAATVAGELEVELPFQPTERREELAEAAFPLESWGEGDASVEQDAYAYAASWAVAAELADSVGQEGLQLAWSRIAHGYSPYDPATEPRTPAEPGLPVLPIDSRELLDHLEAVADVDLAPLFAEYVFDDGVRPELEARADARAAHAQLLEVADGWGSPEPVRVDLAAWRFDSATARIEEARGWLEDRDRLIETAEAAGLTVPQRLRDRYRTAGGGADAAAELRAEQAVVDDYVEVIGMAVAQRDVLERVGLLGGPDPEALLSDANALFGEGELRGAAEAIEAARGRLESAFTVGLVRVLAALVVTVLLLLGAVTLVRRRRSEPDTVYTAAE